jgi:hypothetical protein
LPIPFVQAESFRRTQNPKIPAKSPRLRFNRIENRWFSRQELDEAFVRGVVDRVLGWDCGDRG